MRRDGAPGGSTSLAPGTGSGDVLACERREDDDRTYEDY